VEPKQPLWVAIFAGSVGGKLVSGPCCLSALQMLAKLLHVFNGCTHACTHSARLTHHHARVDVPGPRVLLTLNCLAS
jgi:hypothetical protein